MNILLLFFSWKNSFGTVEKKKMIRTCMHKNEHGRSQFIFQLLMQNNCIFYHFLSIFLSHPSLLKCLLDQAENYLIGNDMEQDDDARAWFPCPFCYVEVEISVLCRHLLEEHCFDLKNAVLKIYTAQIDLVSPPTPPTHPPTHTFSWYEEIILQFHCNGMMIPISVSGLSNMCSKPRERSNWAFYGTTFIFSKGISLSLYELLIASQIRSRCLTFTLFKDTLINCWETKLVCYIVRFGTWLCLDRKLKSKFRMFYGSISISFWSAEEEKEPSIWVQWVKDASEGPGWTKFIYRYKPGEW